MDNKINQSLSKIIKNSKIHKGQRNSDGCGNKGPKPVSKSLNNSKSEKYRKIEKHLDQNALTRLKVRDINHRANLE